MVKCLTQEHNILVTAGFEPATFELQAKSFIHCATHAHALMYVMHWPKVYFQNYRLFWKCKHGKDTFVHPVIHIFGMIFTKTNSTWNGESNGLTNWYTSVFPLCISVLINILALTYLKTLTVGEEKTAILKGVRCDRPSTNENRKWHLPANPVC